MELLVYVRNHGGFGGRNTFVGASVGTSPTIEHPPARAPLTSFAEFRVDDGVDDPVEELRAAVRDVFAVLGNEPHDRTVYWTRPHSALKVCLGPEFDRPHQIEGELAEMLALCSPKLATDHDAPVAPRPHFASEPTFAP